MADSLDKPLRHGEFGHGIPASKASIDALTKRFVTTFPEPLLRLWHAEDCIPLETLDAHLLGPTEILQLVNEEAWHAEFVKRGYVPILDDHQSNYLTVIVRPPLAYRVVYFPHNDESRLLYRDVNGFAGELLAALDGEDSAALFFHETQGDYPPDAPCSPNDQKAAQELMATDCTSPEWNYAAQLLDASNLDEWAKLLETDHFVRRDVVARLRQMREPAIRALLERDQRAFKAFALAVAKAAQSAGLEVGEQKQDVLQVGGNWMNLEAFFHRRNIPNSMPRLLAWFEDLTAGRNPYDRIDHFMMD